jgi:predicted Zn-ribbon and HTH transcriptional regulator
MSDGNYQLKGQDVWIPRREYDDLKRKAELFKHSMKMDVYSCEECSRAFAVEKDEDPKVCPNCESYLWEYSHSAHVINDCKGDFIGILNISDLPNN